MRRRIAEYVRSNPGVHFSAIVRELDLATGQTQYHLRKLLRRGEVTAEERHGQTHYFDDGYDDWERAAITLLRRETDRAIVALVLEAESIAPDAIATRLDVARSTVEWHLDRLTEERVLEKRYDSKGRVTVVAVDPERTRTLLSTLDPGVADRLVDRFTRLVDGAMTVDDVDSGHLDSE
ncbi:ArsR family transcriptional regulator [Halalkaliarchaeum desulfuricum]|uniref:ArsR family transcriptional regulator n=1 Tax=Halalkaliarchaeum desulfuricum TaxID=2055893 RepID=A0A343TN09_9EURY|nr:ArsR family transcriptional regulator [Halalkaliarchaeum desulfuricum]